MPKPPNSVGRERRVSVVRWVRGSGGSGGSPPARRRAWSNRSKGDFSALHVWISLLGHSEEIFTWPLITCFAFTQSPLVFLYVILLIGCFCTKRFLNCSEEVIVKESCEGFYMEILFSHSEEGSVVRPLVSSSIAIVIFCFWTYSWRKKFQYYTPSSGSLFWRFVKWLIKET